MGQPQRRRFRRSSDLLWLIRWLVLLLLLLDVLRYQPLTGGATFSAQVALGLIVVAVVVNLLLRRIGLRPRTIAGDRRLALLGIGIDLGLVTTFVVLFGGTVSSTPELLYPVVITEAAVAFGLRGALGVGVVAGVALFGRYVWETRVDGAVWLATMPWFAAGSLVLVAITAGLLAEWLVREQAKLRDALTLRDHELRWRQGLLDMLAHDLRSPIAAASSSAALIADRGPSLTPEQVGKLASVTRRQADRGLRLLDDLLDLGRARAGALEVRRAPVDIVDFVRATLAELPDRFSANTEIVVRATGPLVAEVDAARLAQVLWNLLTNAEKHGAPPVTIRLDRAPGLVIIEVVDRGPGVPADVEKELFAPYHSGGGEGSTGLGLWISRLLVDAQGGRLAYLRDAQETRFVVQLEEAAGRGAPALEARAGE